MLAYRKILFGMIFVPVLLLAVKVEAQIVSAYPYGYPPGYVPRRVYREAARRDGWRYVPYYGYLKPLGYAKVWTGYGYAYRPVYGLPQPAPVVLAPLAPQPYSSSASVSVDKTPIAPQPEAPVAPQSVSPTPATDLEPIPTPQGEPSP
jgi:hypothetical protein